MDPTKTASLYVPSSTLSSCLTLPDSHRDRGLHWVAGSGSGKSLGLGYLAYVDCLRGVPQVLFDPAGQMIDAFLLRVSLLPPEERKRVWSRSRG